MHNDLTPSQRAYGRLMQKRHGAPPYDTSQHPYALDRLAHSFCYHPIPYLLAIGGVLLAVVICIGP